MPRRSTAHTPHQARYAGWLLAAYLLVVATATAAPWVAPRPYGSICSAAAVAGTGQDVDDQARAALDCALCLPLQAPTTRSLAGVALPHGPEYWPRARSLESPAPRLAALPPARGPPSV